jgi:hypothetical protein
MRRLKKELWPYKTKVNLLHSTREVEEWLDKTLGAFKGKWNVVQQSTCIEYYFKQDRDLTMFMLRWS